MEANDQKAAAVRTLLGGEKMTVTLATGETQEVFVRRLAIAEYPKFASCLLNESKGMEMVCDQPEGWAETLAPDSYNALAEKMGALNNPSFDPWINRRLRVAKLMEPVVGLVTPETVKALASLKQ